MIKVVLVLGLFLTIACSQNCQIEEEIQQRVKGFFSPWSETGLTRKFIVECNHTDYTCLVEFRNGRVISDCLTPVWRQNFEKLGSQIPDTLLLINLMDPPRIVKNKCEEFGDPRECACDKNYTKPNHGFFLARQNWTPIFIKFPLFGPTTIPECFLDIVIPSEYHFQRPYMTVETQWETAKNVALWRGTTTGSDFKVLTPHFSLFHRQRFVSLCKKIKNCDAKFTSIIQCSEQTCKEMKQIYGEAPFIVAVQQSKYKILLDIDGNTYSGRTLLFLGFGSLLLKMSIFLDFGTLFTKPWLHYIPVTMEMDDLESKIQWAIEKDEQVKEIARRGRNRSMSIYVNHTLECYIVYLFTEYSKLFRDEAHLSSQELYHLPLGSSQKKVES